MKTLRTRLLLAFSFLYSMILAGLGFILGQLFPVYLENTIDENLMKTEKDIVAVMKDNNIVLTAQQIQELEKVMPKSFLLEEIATAKLQFWLILIVALVFAFLLLLFITDRLLKNLTKSVEHVTHTALELAKGNYRARAYEMGEVATSQLSKSINSLARNLQDMMLVREMEQERLKTLIENMGSALIMIGREGDISVVNRFFLKLFNKSNQDVKKHVFRDLGVDENLEEFVDYVFMTEQPYRKQIEISIEGRKRHMEVYGAPVIGEHGHWLGVVIVMHDITELKQLEQVRKDFVANVSHELRTPITSIKGFSETLIDGAYKDEDTLLSFLDIMYKESNRLQMLVQDLLELSKIEREGFKIDIIPTSLNAIVRSSIEMAKMPIEQKHMTLKVTDDEEVIVLGDANRLIQVAVNLIVNAVTYSLDYKTVHINVTKHNDYGVMEVIDEGIGIQKAEIPRVFERFYRVDRARSRNSGGTGLGLAIVKHLVEAHHGKIIVKSQEGEGTTIRILIPLAKEQ
ncbi:two-component system histidine kinase PnpS [Kurthia sibirica]|uniref:histidine kinase n=1 Tax=Kurthia sibirica TaxID=202750 RepID=A0A2U3ANT1_9BACL|nr:ATP-binding protein [Kurthia sibirica]PWI26187.1 PAS domain-containing sensor histidine kinase [Kurthia sibirica]GEK35377.1 hypothetical protein KSI01_29100 [Kurthia sibirica]